MQRSKKDRKIQKQIKGGGLNKALFHISHLAGTKRSARIKRKDYGNYDRGLFQC